MSTPPTHHRYLLAVAAAILVFAMLPLQLAMGWLDRPFAGILLDPDGHVSSFGLPTWDGFTQDLHFPDRIVSVEGVPLDPPAPGTYRAATWDRVVGEAFVQGRARVHVHALVGPDQRPRDLELAISKPERLAFWLIGAAPVGIALLYATGALIALAASPRGRLARTFAKTTLFAALFLFTLLDYHTTRTLVPLFHLAFAMVPMGFFVLPLRLPDDVPLLVRHPRLVAGLDALGLALGLGMITAHLAGASTLPLRDVCSALFPASFFFFAATFLLRFWRATGDRRATMRALIVAMVPPHIVLGVAFVLGTLSRDGATVAFLAVPALALTPLSTFFALIRHDLWGSRALLSRVLMRLVITGITCAFAIALGAVVAAAFHVDLAGALLAATVAGTAAGVLAEPALRVGDRALFPSRAVYKPTIEQLSEELTLVTMPEEVGHAVERTVLRWLPCEKVEFCFLGAHADSRGDESEVSGIRSLSAPAASPAPAPDASPNASPNAPNASPNAAPNAPPNASPNAPNGSPNAPNAPNAPRDELSIDVLFRGSPLAVLRVGKKRGGALFTSEDLDLLRTIANQAALALAHALSYAELELRRRQQAAAWRGEREALVETVAAEIAHEIRYPINYFRSIFERGKSGRELDAEAIDIGCEEVDRLERLVSGLRRVPNRRLERKVIAVEELVTKAGRLLHDQLGARPLVVEIAGHPAIRCDSDQTIQVVVNLISNALDAAGEDGQVGVTWANHPRGARFTVWDTGPGFAGEPARVFAPWYTTKPRGTGLGLAISHRIVRAHGWSIDPDRASGRTLFHVSIPSSDIVSITPAGGAGVEVA
jgi:signal transduction histidine kinase